MYLVYQWMPSPSVFFFFFNFFISVVCVSTADLLMRGRASQSNYKIPLSTNRALHRAKTTFPFFFPLFVCIDMCTRLIQLRKRMLYDTDENLRVRISLNLNCSYFFISIINLALSNCNPSIKGNNSSFDSKIFFCIDLNLNFLITIYNDKLMRMINDIS